MREVSMTDYNLQRFLDAQRGDYEQALQKLETGGNIPIGFGIYFLN